MTVGLLCPYVHVSLDWSAAATAFVMVNFRPKCLTSPLVSLSTSDSTWREPYKHTEIQLLNKDSEHLLYVRQH